MIFRSMFHEGKHAQHAVPFKRPASNSNISNNDILSHIRHDNIKDGIEDANQNGRIDGDNGDGYYAGTETWGETDPNEIDSDGDTFSDYNEKQWGYNPLLDDTDGDGINDNVEDANSNGNLDANETVNGKRKVVNYGK